MEKQEAEKGAKDLKNKLGKGWKIRVWENLGWHYEANSKCISIYFHGGEYSCLINDDMDGSGVGAQHLDCSFYNTDPKKVVLKAVETVNKYYEKMKTVNDHMNKIKDELNKK